jgi:hypothetical protein
MSMSFHSKHQWLRPALRRPNQPNSLGSDPPIHRLVPRELRQPHRIVGLPPAASFASLSRPISRSRIEGPGAQASTGDGELTLANGENAHEFRVRATLDGGRGRQV